MIGAMPKVTFLTTGVLPVPAVNGGAVEGLVETLLRFNEETPRFDFSVVSIWDENAVNASRCYEHTSFLYLRPPAAVTALDKSVFSVAKHLMRKRNVSSYRFIFERFWYLRRMARLIASRDFGTLVVENHPSIYLALKYEGNANRYANRYYYHLHNVFPDFYGCREIACKAKSVLSISSFIQESYDKLVGGLSTPQKMVLMNCVDCESYASRFSRQEVSAFRGKFGLLPSDFVFMFSGRITPEKGVRELLEGFSLVSDRMPCARLMIVGSAFFGSDIKSDYEVTVKLLSEQLSNKVVFTGFIPHDEMPLAYAASDVCCCPSTWDEPACLSVLEGMAAGKPVITTRSGGIPEYTGEGNAILLEREENLPKFIADAMKSLYENDNLRKELATNGRIRASAFDSRHYLAKFAECIEAVGDK